MSPRQGTSGRAKAWPAQSRAGVGDGGIGIEAVIDQLQQTHAPGLGVAMVLQAKQIAIGRCGIDTHEHWLTGLKDLVMGTDAHAAQIATAADRPSRFDSTGDDVVHCTEGDTPVKDIAEQFDDGPVRAVADHHQGQDQLPQPSLGHREVEEDLLGLGFGGKGAGQSILGGVGLVVEELAADLMSPGPDP